MTQVDPEQRHEKISGLQSFGGTMRETGAVAVRPVMAGYNTSKSVIETIVHWEAVQNLGGVVGVSLGLRDGARPIKAEGKPAKIDIFDGEDPWKRQN